MALTIFAIKKQPLFPRKVLSLFKLIAGLLTYGTLLFAFPANYLPVALKKSTHPITVTGSLQILTGFPIKN
jgi:hypothetical protein